MKYYLLSSILMCLGCETLNVANTGAGYRSENFPKLENRDCIEQALRSTANVEFISRRNETSEGKSIIKNETRQFLAEVFSYRISTAGGHLTEATYTITDQVSQDGKYEKTAVENAFAPIKAGPQSREQKQQAIDTLANVNKSVQTQCHLPNLRLDLYQN